MVIISLTLIGCDYHPWLSLILMASKTDTEVNKTKFGLETKPSSESGPACPLLFSLAEGSSILIACDLHIKMGVRYLVRMACNESVIRRYTWAEGGRLFLLDGPSGRWHLIPVMNISF